LAKILQFAPAFINSLTISRHPFSLTIIKGDFPSLSIALRLVFAEINILTNSIFLLFMASVKIELLQGSKEIK